MGYAMTPPLFRPASVRAAFTLAAAAVCSACTVNPVVPWKAPDIHVTGTGMPYAYAYADARRNAYLAEISRQSGQAADLNNALVGAGALALALTAGKAGKDGIAALALLGGTSYALGGMNLGKQKLLVLQAGVEAVNCAKQAVIPLNWSKEDRDQLISSLTTLATARSEMADKADALRAQLAKPGGEAKERTDAEALLQQAGALQEQSAPVLANGWGLARQVNQAADQLVVAIDKIDAAVVRAGLDNMMELSAVPAIIAGLGGFAAGIVPGATLPFGAKPGDPVTEKSVTIRKAGDPPALGTASAELAQAMRNVRAASQIVAQLVQLSDATPSVQALRACGVTDAHFPLRASVAKLQFALATEATRSFVISGGTKPYIAELADTPVSGVTVRSPVPFDSRVQVSVSKDVVAAQSASIRIMDSSSPMRSEIVALELGQAAPAPAVTAPPAAARTQFDDPVALVDHFNADGRVVKLNAAGALPAIDFTMHKPVRYESGNLVFVLACTPAPPAGQCYAKETVRGQLFSGLTLSGNADGAASNAKISTSPANCLCAK